MGPVARRVEGVDEGGMQRLHLETGKELMKSG
jgi:hypothetical protein